MPTEQIERASEWWTDEREARWSEIDEACRKVRRNYDDDRLFGGLSLHASAPNPHGINADNTPDDWYVTLPYEPGEVDVETISSMLADELDEPLTVRERPDGWAPGYWLISDESEDDE